MRKEKLTQEHIKQLEQSGIELTKLTQASLHIYEPEEYLCLEGQPFVYLSLIASGRCKVSYTTRDGKTLLYCFSSRNNYLGDIELMIGEPEFVTNVCVVTKVVCIGIPVAPNSTYLKNNISFLNRIGYLLATKLDRSGKKSTYTALHPLEERLCSYILFTSYQGSFQEKLTEVAELLGTSYRHLLRTLEGLCACGALVKEKGGYCIANADLLVDKSDEYPAEELLQ